MIKCTDCLLKRDNERCRKDVSKKGLRCGEIHGNNNQKENR